MNCNPFYADADFHVFNLTPEEEKAITEEATATHTFTPVNSTDDVSEIIH